LTFAVSPGLFLLVFNLAVSLERAKTHGLSLPSVWLGRTDAVIEQI
jgi:hypothetical protein